MSNVVREVEPVKRLSRSLQLFTLRRAFYTSGHNDATAQPRLTGRPLFSLQRTQAR